MKSASHSLISLVALATVLPNVLAVSEWGQCGGANYSGSTTCDSGLSCIYFNEWYSQCQKVNTPSNSGCPVPTSTTTTSTTQTSTSTTSTSTTSGGGGGTGGFVKTSGQKFTVNGATFNCVGSNAYWMAQLGSTSLMAQAFSEIAQAGTTCLRTWGFNDVTSAGGTYYQLWQNGTPTINTGADGLGKFDSVVAEAKKAGIRLIVALTNNWGDYGGMDMYISQILGGGQAHSNFYTNTNIKNAYKNYVKAFVSRYANEPTIMAWELANEPRCNGCSVSVITNWASEMSAVIYQVHRL
ncbi:glycoside hydrolase [Serendipita vermifera]|nr:glycoside hydrolase [Serendipita vermifera]